MCNFSNVHRTCTSLSPSSPSASTLSVMVVEENNQREKLIFYWIIIFPARTKDRIILLSDINCTTCQHIFSLNTTIWISKQNFMISFPTLLLGMNKNIYANTHTCKHKYKRRGILHWQAFFVCSVWGCWLSVLHKMVVDGCAGIAYRSVWRCKN